MKRRLIKKWSCFYVASRDYECSHCENTIHFGSEYTRRVYATKTVIEVERAHEYPDCEAGSR